MHWIAIIEGAVASLVVLLLAGSRNQVSGWFLRRKIRRELQKATLGSGVLGISTVVRNTSQVELRVREVLLCTPRMSFKFNPAGEESSSGRYAELFGLPNPNVPGADTFPRVPPLTGYSFSLPADFVIQFEGPAIGLSITVEYDSYSGRRKILQVETKDWANQLTRKTLDHFEKEYRRGALNVARANFHLSPVPVTSGDDTHADACEVGPTLEEASKTEKVASNPLAAVTAALGTGIIGAACPPMAVLSSALSMLVTIPAGILFKKRLETAFAEIDEHFRSNEEAIRNLTDGQYDFVVSVVNTLLRTVDERKIEFLKSAIKNGLQEPFDHYEAELISRILRDISYEEIRFLMEWIKIGRISVMESGKPDTISPKSEKRLILASLTAIGVMMQSDRIGLDVNSYEFSPIAPKIVKLLS